jgi:hypothetical protein
MLNIPKISVGDTLELKKPHPCGARTFSVLRVGSDIRIVCTGCGRDMTLERVKLEKSIRKIIPTVPDGAGSLQGEGQP